MSTDNFSTVNSVSDPARSLAAVTPSDTVDLPTVTKGLYIGVTGDVAVIAVDNTTSVVLKGALAGRVLPIRVSRVLATGTTATNIVALY